MALSGTGRARVDATIVCKSCLVRGRRGSTATHAVAWRRWALVGGGAETHPHAQARVGWGGEGVWVVGRRGRCVGPLGLLPVPAAPRLFAVLSLFARCPLGRAIASFPPRRRVRSLASPGYGRVCARACHVRHVSRASCPCLCLLLHQRVRWLPPRRPVAYVRERLLRRSCSYQLCAVRLRGVS